MDITRRNIKSRNGWSSRSRPCNLRPAAEAPDFGTLVSAAYGRSTRASALDLPISVHDARRVRSRIWRRQRRYARISGAPNLVPNWSLEAGLNGPRTNSVASHEPMTPSLTPMCDVSPQRGPGTGRSPGSGRWRLEHMQSGPPLSSAPATIGASDHQAVGEALLTRLVSSSPWLR